MEELPRTGTAPSNAQTLRRTHRSKVSRSVHVLFTSRDEDEYTTLSDPRR